MLIRLFRYRESLKQADARSLYDAELSLPNGLPDLELSVYQAEIGTLIQLALEHFADAGNDPPRHATGMDVQPARGEAVSQPTGGRFALTSAAHRILRFQDEADQLEFARLLVNLLASGGSAAATHEKPDLRDWLKLRLDDGDEEWVRFMSSDRESWKKFPKRR